MRVPEVLLLILLIMGAVLAAAFFIEEQPSEEVTGDDGATRTVYRGHGITHPDFTTMQVGGPGAERHEKALWIGFALGLTEIAFFLGLLYFGVRRRGEGIGPFRPYMIGGAVVYVLIFCALIFSYRGYMSDPAGVPYFLGFPAPTAWMVYGVWLWPISFMFLYMWKFDEWVYTEADAAEFERLVAARRAREQA